MLHALYVWSAIFHDKTLQYWNVIYNVRQAEWQKIAIVPWKIIFNINEAIMYMAFFHMHIREIVGNYDISIWDIYFLNFSISTVSIT